jgi:hypothetical protein
MAKSANESFSAKAIYGLITLQVMEDHPPVAWVAAVRVFGTTLAVALVEAYASTIGTVLSSQRGGTRAEVLEI